MLDSEVFLKTQYLKYPVNTTGKVINIEHLGEHRWNIVVRWPDFREDWFSKSEYNDYLYEV